MTSARRRAAPAFTSSVPGGAWSRATLTARELSEERVGAAFDAERGDAHVAGIDGRLGRQRVDERLDRSEQRGPVAARQVGATDRALEEDVAGEDRLLVG